MVEYFLTDQTAGKPPGTGAVQKYWNRGRPRVASGQSSLLPPWFTASWLLCQSSGTSVCSTPRRCGVHGADCCGSGKPTSATLRRDSVSAVAARTTSPTSFQLSSVRQSGKHGVFLNGFRQDSCTTSSSFLAWGQQSVPEVFELDICSCRRGPKDQHARGLSGRRKHVGCVSFRLLTRGQGSYRRGAKRPTSTGLVKSSKLCPGF